MTGHAQSFERGGEYGDSTRKSSGQHSRVQTTARQRLRRVLAARASPWWLQRGREMQAHKQGGEQAASAVAQVEAERSARRAQSVRRLEAVLQRLQVESRREDVKEAVDRARQLQSAGEWVLDEMGAEAPIDASDSDSGESTSEGGGVSLAKDPPPRQVRWTEPLVA